MVGSEYALEPTPLSPMSSLLGGVLFLDDKRCVSSVNGNLAAVVLCPGGMFVSGNKHKRKSVLIISMFFLPMLTWMSWTLPCTSTELVW